MNARDDFYDRHSPLTDRMLAVIPDAAETPEDLLIQAEEARARARKALQRLPDKDRRTLLGEQSMSGRKLAAIEGVSHQAVQKRLKAARLKFAWYVGAGSLFTGIDIHRDFWWRVPNEVTRFLIILWRERSIAATAAELRLAPDRLREMYRAVMATTLPSLVREDADRYAKYQRGFAALREAVQHGLFSRGVGVEHTKKARGGKK